MIPDNPKYIPRVCYEIFVRSFCDSNGDGIGDLNGIISKLDYLQELGIEAIWLTPVHPSPSYHKYDLTDYFDIDPEFGTMEDFKRLLQKAHEHDIAVYMDLIVNHTSTLHPWFTEARKSPDNLYRNYYWWMTAPQIEELGIAQRQTSDDSQEVYPWHENMDDPEKYYGLFYKGMPDLNYHSEELKIELQKIVRFWLNDVGIDGFRLDAARHIFPEWEKEWSLEFWKFFSELIHETKPGAFTVGEVWAETEEVAPYFRSLNATFHFDLSFALQRILIQEKDENLISKLLNSYELFAKYNPLFIDAIMLTNHDQERIGSVVGNNTDKIKLAASILLTLPGQPYVYYGEEIGMLGTKPDPYIREPFLWTDKEHDPDKTSWIQAEFSTNQTIKPLSEQKNDAQSIFNHYKSLIKLRKAEPAISQLIAPNILNIDLDDDNLMCYERPHADKSILVIHNLSRYYKIIHLPDEKKYFSNVLFASHFIPAPVSGNLEMPAYSSIVLSQIF